MIITEFQKKKFFNKVVKTDACWEWIGCVNDHGYGKVKINYKSLRCHIVSWIIHNGEIPNKLFVLHKCDNRKCVNPNHLFLGTHQDNMNDMDSKGRRASQKGTDNSQFGSFWITNGINNSKWRDDYGIIPFDFRRGRTNPKGKYYHDL